MPQPTIRSLQLNDKDFNTIVSVALGAPIILTGLIAGQSLTYSGSPLAWRNVAGAGGSITAGDGLQSTAGAGSPFTGTFSVDSTVARLNTALNTFSAGSTAIAIDDTAGAADERIWRIQNISGQFLIRTRTDADGVGNDALIFERTGTTVDSITSTAPTLITASGVGTSSGLQLSSNVPTLVFNDNDGGANATIWDITAGANVLDFRTRTDAHGTGATWLTVNRSGTTVGEVAFTGTSLTFNGQAVHFGSPQPAGGGAFVDSGSPITTINNASLAIDNTLRILDPGQTDYMDLWHDGSSFWFDTVNTNSINFRLGSNDPVRITTNAITIRDRSSLQLFGLNNNDSTSIIQDSEELHFAPQAGATFGSSKIVIGEGMPFKMTQDVKSYQALLAGSPSSMIFEWGSPTGAGYTFDEYTQSENIVTGFVGVQDWKIKGLRGDMILSRAGSPSAFEVIQTEKLQTSSVTSFGTDAFSIGKESAYLVTCGSPSGGFIQIGGIAGGTDGKRIIIFNTTAGGPGSPSDLSNLESVIIEHEEATATATDRILCPNRLDITIGEYESTELMYDESVSRWRVISTTSNLSGA